MTLVHGEVELQLRIRQMRWEADGVLSLDLQRPDGAALPAWAAGAHLDLHLPGRLIRQYSLCGRPADRKTWRIAVLRELHGRGGSQAVHDQLRPGDLVTVVGPRNRFQLHEARAYLFIAGGIGITPLLPMVESIASAGLQWTLAYGGRTRASMAFLDELSAYGADVRVWPQDECGLLDLESLLRELCPGTAVYCCGPEPLLAAVQQRCANRPDVSLYVERFSAKQQDPVDSGAEREFDVILARTGRTVRVASGSSILEALERDGLNPANSCREGICGTCETVVLDGLPDHRDSLLSDEERAENKTMMICVGRSLSDQLVLDL